MSLASTGPYSTSAFRKPAAKAALVDLKESSQLILSECFRQFGIESVILNGPAARRLEKEKFEACVVKLLPGAENIMQTVRGSQSNHRMVLYGVGGTVQDAMKFSRYCVNAVFNEPLERQSALKLVRSTQMLVQHEYRRYARIPVITEVAITLSESRQILASSIDLSSGGISIQCPEMLTPGQSLEVSFEMLTLPRVWLRGNVSWKRADRHSFGIRFDAKDERRQKVKQWIDAYLES